MTGDRQIGSQADASNSGRESGTSIEPWLKKRADRLSDQLFLYVSYSIWRLCASFLGLHLLRGGDADDDGNGCLTFEISKGRFGFKLTAPYDENRRKAASELAKKNTERLRRQAQ